MTNEEKAIVAVAQAISDYCEERDGCKGCIFHDDFHAMCRLADVPNGWGLGNIKRKEAVTIVNQNGKNCTHIDNVGVLNL